MDRIHELALINNSGTPGYWKDQQWRLYYPIRECYKIMQRLRSDQEVVLFLACFAALHY
jgi:hypothetical protein